MYFEQTKINNAIGQTPFGERTMSNGLCGPQRGGNTIRAIPGELRSGGPSIADKHVQIFVHVLFERRRFP